jgi:preprotein translocase subunit SecF
MLDKYVEILLMVGILVNVYNNITINSCVILSNE